MQRNSSREVTTMLRSAKTTQPTQIPQTPEALDLAPQFLEVVACPSCHSTFALSLIHI